MLSQNNCHGAKRLGAYLKYSELSCGSCGQLVDLKHRPAAKSNVILALTVRVAANINYDAEDPVLSQDYKFVLSLKQDSINMRCDFFIDIDSHAAAIVVNAVTCDNVKILLH